MPREYTIRERERLDRLASKLTALRTFLVDQPIPTNADTPEAWLIMLAEMKRITGNTSNDIGFVSTVLAIA